MKYPKHIYIGSYDPMTFSHQKTWRLSSQKIRRKVDLVIVQNPLKNKGTFSLNERKRIIKKFYKNYGKIFVAKTEKEIISYIKNSKKIFRGLRKDNYKDKKEDDRLKKYFYKKYGLIVKNIVYTKIPKNEEYSSKKLKNLIRSKKTGRVEKYAPEKVIELIRKKL